MSTVNEPVNRPALQTHAHSVRDCRVRALGYVGFEVRDLAAWETFAGILGLQIRDRESDGSLHLRMDEAFHRIIVESGSADDLAYAGWEVADESELHAMTERLRAAHIPVAQGTPDERRRRRVGGFISLNDPSGLRTEIYWGPLIDHQRPFKSSRAIEGFETKDKGLGHIVLTVDDFVSAMWFYRDVLGMRVSDFIEFDRAGTLVTMGFLHCNPRHHSLAFMQIPSAPKRISHLMLELRSLDDVGRTYSLCEEGQLPITMTLGRHTNDLMVSFYLSTPSGFSVEYGWGGRTVDDETWQVQTHQAASMWGHRRLAPLPR